MTGTKITQHLILNNSYLKWSDTRLATKFGVSEKTMKSITTLLEPIKKQYLINLKK